MLLKKIIIKVPARFSSLYLVVYQHLCPGVRVGQPGDGLGWEAVFSELGVIPAPGLDAGVRRAALAGRRISLHNGRRCHGRRRAPKSGYLRPPSPLAIKEPAARPFFFTVSSLVSRRAATLSRQAPLSLLSMIKAHFRGPTASSVPCVGVYTPC